MRNFKFYSIIVIMYLYLLTADMITTVTESASFPLWVTAIIIAVLIFVVVVVVITLAITWKIRSIAKGIDMT